MIDDNFTPDDRPVEVPNIEIEVTADQPKKSKRLYVWIGIITIVTLCAIMTLWYIFRKTNIEELPISVTVEENISKLSDTYEPTAVGSAMSTDSVLGIGLEIYELGGLRASLEYEYPDSADSSIVIFTRSADYRPDYSIMGTTVIDGELSTDPKTDMLRPAYVAISPQGKAVIGLDYDNKMSSHIQKIGGSFFRQQVLLSNGVKPQTFQLHGKVERAAIGRTFDDELFYIITRDKSTMSDFADALKNYGFIDAIYITGGDTWDSYRDTNGVFHPGKYYRPKSDKYDSREESIPLLIFRR